MKPYYFIKRPILAIVIALIIICVGVVATFNIPVSQFPNISPPVVMVRAQFPGANAETAAKVVAAQIENQLNGTSNMLYMATTTSATGSISINLTFEIGTDLNIAINEILNRIYAAMSLLPPVVQQLGVTARKSSPDQLLSIAFYANPYIDPKFISNYLERTVQNDLLLLPTVGNIGVFGTGTYAIRAWLDPNLMQRYSITVNDIQNAIKDQNQEYVIGRSNSPPFTSDKQTESMLALNLIGSQMFSSPKQLAEVVLRNNGNQIIRVKDVARVELGANNYTSRALINFRDENGKFVSYPCSIMQVYLVPGSNQLLAKKQILDLLQEDAKRFPFGLHYRITNDNSRFVAASIHNVVETLIIAIILVTLIILLFLRNLRACLIVIATIPVSLFGTIACLDALGFSLNTISLFALILSIGIVVDDAIIIVENVMRLKEANPNAKLSQIISETMREVKSAVIAIVMVLSIVFIPVMKLGGLSGVMYQQFAVTIACSVIISGISALTFVPALTSRILKIAPLKTKTPSIFENLIGKLTRLYVRLAEMIIIKRKFILMIWLVLILATFGLFKLVSTDFVPLEDQGLIMASMNLPSSASMNETESAARQIMAKLTNNPNISSVLSIIGADFLDSGGQKPYAASFTISLKEWSERSGKHSSADSVIKEINKFNRQIPGLAIKAYNQPPIRGLSTTGGVEFYLENRVGGNAHDLQEVGDKLIARLKKHHEVGNAYQTLNTNTLQISLLPDIDMTKFYKVSLNDLYSTLQTMYSNNNVNFAYLMQGLIWVILEADYRYRATLEGLKNVYLKNANGQMVPVGSLLKIDYSNNAQVIQRFNSYIASRITVIPAKGHTMGDVMQVLRNEVSQLPKGYGYEWFGTSYQLKQSQSTSLTAFIMAFVMIYLVLAALYEMWRLPLIILMGVPFALFGAILVLFIFNMPNDLYFQISLITLLGLSAKNIILLVEFALQHYKEDGNSISSAIYALKIRFRPILMTSVTFIFGTLPLVFANGAGANAEHSLGIGIIGGVIGSVFLATLFTPAYFALFMKNKAKV